MTHIEEGTVAELFRKFQAGEIPPAAKVKVIWEDEETQDEARPESLEELLKQIRQKYSVNRAATMERLAQLDAGRDKTLALFEQWKKEDALKTPEELAEEARMYAEIERDGYPRFNIPDRLSQENL